MKLTLWHGGRNLESDYKDIRASASGRWEHGPGLYLTSHYETAFKYAKGGGKTYKVTIDFDPAKSISNVKVKVKDAIAFVKSVAKVAARADIIERIEANASRKNSDEVNIEVVSNLLLNSEALAPSKTKILAEWLIDNGVQYGVTRFGGRDETVVIVFDRSIIKSVKAIPAKDVSLDDREVDVPAYSLGSFTGGVKESLTFKGFLSNI